MKKYLQLSLMCLLVLSASIFGSCKEDEGGSPNPLLGLSVKMAEKDSSVNTMISIDQANRLVTISLSKPAVDLKHVLCKFDLVNGASLYSPLQTNPVMLDLSDQNGVNITTGDAVVCYNIVTEVDYALKDIKAMAGDLEGVVSIDQKKSLVEIYFNDVADLTQINVDFDISAVSTMIDPSTTSALMDLSADTTEVKMYNKFSGEVVYKLICWCSPASEYLPITGVNATVEETDENTYAITTTGAGAAIVTARYPSSLGTVLSFEYKAVDSIGRPLLSLDVRNKDLSMYGYILDEQADWVSYSVDMGGIISDVGVAPSYLLTIGLGDVADKEIEIRNLQIREKTVDEITALENAYFFEFDKEPRTTMDFENVTNNSDYVTYKFTPTSDGDPNMQTEKRKRSIDLTTENQLYFEYKADIDFHVEIFFKVVGGYSKDAGPKNLASDVWVPVHVDWTSALGDLAKAHPDAGDSGATGRFDVFGISGVNVPIYIRNLRLEKK